MDIIQIILNIFSGLSFIIYGILFFTSRAIKNDFERFGLEQYLVLVGILEILGGFGLLIGLKIHLILLISSGGLALLMLLGLGVRIKVKDGFLLSLPSFLFMIINSYLFLNALYMGEQ